MSLDSIVSVTITAQTTTPSRAGFGTPLIAAYHDQFADTVRTYSSLKGVSDDFGSTHTVTKLAKILFGQDLAPPQVKVGKRSAFTQTIELTPTDTTEGLEYKVTIGGEEATYTVGSGDTVANIVTGLTSAINALTVAVTATDNTTEVSVAADSAGAFFEYEDRNRELDLQDVTSDPGISSDLDDIETFDDDWYALLLDNQSKAEIEAAATWIEAKAKIFVTDSADSDILDSGSSSDVAANLQSSAYDRTGLLYHHNVGDWAAAGWVGRMLPTDPGSVTWAHKTIKGVPFTKLTTTERTAIEDKGGNYYTRVAGVNITRWGTAASGEYINTTRGVDWLTARIQERIFGVLVNNPKIPYTNRGAELMRNEVEAQLGIAADRGFITRDSIVVTVPDVADISDADKGNRLLPDLDFNATLAGAVHKVAVSGVVSL